MLAAACENGCFGRMQFCSVALLTQDTTNAAHNTTTHPESATTIRGHWQLDIVIVTASRSAFSRRQLSNLLGGRGTTGQPRAVCGLTVCRLRDSLEVCIFAGNLVLFVFLIIDAFPWIIAIAASEKSSLFLLPLFLLMYASYVPSSYS